MSNNTSSSEFIRLVNQTMHERNTNYNEAWFLCKRMYPESYQAMMDAPSRHQPHRAAANHKPQPMPAASREFIDMVNEKMRGQHLDWHTAWRRCKALRPDLYATMEAANEKLQTSVDGQRVYPAWPVPPGVLSAMGLPQNATQEQYKIYQTAEKTRVTPEIAAVVVHAIIRFEQLQSGVSFDTVMAHLQRRRPELFKEIQKL